MKVTVASESTALLFRTEGLSRCEADEDNISSRTGQFLIIVEVLITSDLKKTCY